MFAARRAWRALTNNMSFDEVYCNQCIIEQATAVYGRAFKSILPTPSSCSASEASRPASSVWITSSHSCLVCHPLLMRCVPSFRRLQSCSAYVLTFAMAFFISDLRHISKTPCSCRVGGGNPHNNGIHSGLLPCSPGDPFDKLQVSQVRDSIYSTSATASRREKLALCSLAMWSGNARVLCVSIFRLASSGNMQFMAVSPPHSI